MAPQNEGAIVKVRNLKETARAFNNISDDLSGELKKELEDAAEPVAVTAERYALSRIRNLTEKSGWAEMKIGVSRSSALVYMVPEKRGKGGRGRKKRSRPEFGDLLMDRAMDPSATENEGQINENIENALDRLSRREGF